MRKRTINYLADTMFWYLLYLLPVVAFLLYIVASGNYLSIIEFFDLIGFSFVNDNIIVSTLSSIFGAEGVLPFFSNDVPFIIGSWFVGVFLCHLAVDFILFIPRLCHKWFNHFYQGD